MSLEYKDIHGCASCGHSFADTENAFVWYCNSCARVMGFNITKRNPVNIEILPKETLTIALIEQAENPLRG